MNALEALTVRRAAPRTLDSVRKLLAYIGNPDRSYRSVQVVGTNGKGSVSAMLDSVLRAHGLRVGLFTSPALVNICERISVCGERITERDLGRLADAVLAKERHSNFSGFDRLTMCAALFFKEKKVDAAVFECGLGGRLDPTTALKRGAIAVTRISYDHTELLGSTLSAIAGEKAGALIKNVPAVLAPQEPEVLEVFRNRALAAGAPLFEISEGSILPLAASLSGQRFSLSIRGRDLSGLELSLLGAHQLENAAVAVQTAYVFCPPSEASLRQGLKKVSWPCRMERFDKTSRRPETLIDGAHNPSGAKALAKSCELLPSPPVLLFAARAEKDVRGMLEALGPAVERAIVTQVQGGAPAQELMRICVSLGIPCEAAVCDDALESAIQKCEKDRALLITGSIYFAGAMRERILSLE